MTLTAERGFAFDGAPFERRGRAVQERRSWASAQPFVPRLTPHNAGVEHERRWSRVSKSFRRRAVALDVTVVAALGAVLMVPLYGTKLATVGLVALGVVGVIGLAVLFGAYDLRSLGDGPAEYQALIRVGGVGMIVLIGLSYATMAEISRFLVLGGVPLVVAALVVVRFVHRKFLHRERAKGHALVPALVVGHPADVRRVSQDLSRAQHQGLRVVGACVPDLDEVHTDPQVPVIGAIADVPQVVADHGIDMVVVAGAPLGGEALRRMSWALDRAGAQLTVAPDLVDVGAPRLALRPTGDLSLLELEVATPRRRMLAKALLDRVLGTVIMLVALPVILGAAALVRATSPGPAFYRQTRVGVDGDPFTMWKLRSMYIDADERRAALLRDSDGDGVLFKMRNDPRVTPMGRVLRRFSIDELPQLFNVFSGDMSLVGPRPPLVEEVESYADAVHRRLRVKPGLTGLWQVSGRSDLSWEESVRLDLRYVDNWSVLMDVTILWKTFRAVVGASGAY